MVSGMVSTGMPARIGGTHRKHGVAERRHSRDMLVATPQTGGACPAAGAIPDSPSVPTRLAFPMFVMVIAAFCGDLQAGLMSLVPVDTQTGLQQALSVNSAMAMPWEERPEGDSSPFVDGQSSELEGFPDPRGTRVVSVACRSLETMWQGDDLIGFFATLDRVLLPPLLPNDLAKIPI